jgi:hypothetical protein
MARVLILIVNYNGAAYIRACLASLRQAVGGRADAEILVVDNASTDGSAALVREVPEVHLIGSATNRGFAGGNNVGLCWALEREFDYVYLLNQDTEVEPDFLDEAVRVAEADPSIAAVQSKLLLFQDKRRVCTLGNRIHYLGFGYNGNYGEIDATASLNGAAPEVAYACGAGVLLRASALRESGLFNEELFLYHEDLDLGWRLRLQDYRIVMAPRSVVYHKYEFSRNRNKFYYMERNRYMVMFQNCRAATLALLAVPAAIMQLGMMFYALANGYARDELRMLQYFCRRDTWRRIRATRRAVQRARRIGDRAVFRHFCGKVEFEALQSWVLKRVANPVFNAVWVVMRPLIRW